MSCKMEKEVGWEPKAVRLILFFVGASGALFLLLLLVLRTDRDQVLGREASILSRPLTANASFSFSARILSPAACSTYGYESTGVSIAQVGQVGHHHTFFSSSSISFHFAPNNFPISPTRGQGVL